MELIRQKAWIVVAVLLLIADQVHSEVRPGRGPLIGYVHQGKVWAATDAEPATTSCSVFQGALLSEKPPDEFFLYAMKDLEHSYVWRISQNLFWQGTGRPISDNRIYQYALEDFKMFDSRKPDERGRKIRERYPADLLLSQKQLWMLPVLGLARDQKQDTDVYYDFYPTGVKKLLIFQLHKKTIQILQCEFTEANEKDRKWHWWDYKWAEKPIEVIDATFHTPFIVYPSGKTYYFITQFCECYGLKDNGKGGRVTELIWGKEDQPIARIITDNATGKTFAFTLPLERKDGTKAKPGYFELSPKPELIEYDPSKIQKNNFAYPYKQIRECVDVLLADKKIDPEKHKKKDKR